MKQLLIIGSNNQKTLPNYQRFFQNFFPLQLPKSEGQKEQRHPSEDDKNDAVTASTIQDTEIIIEDADQDQHPGSSKKQTGESTSTPKQDKIQAELSDVQDQVNMLYKKGALEC